MTEFLEYVRRRRAELRKELQELDVAERIYRQANPGTAVDVPDSGELFESARKWAEGRRSVLVPKTIQHMIVQLLDEAYPAGFTALEILDLIQARWKPELERTSLSPQLTRLKGSTAIKNEKGKWYLVVKDTGVPAEGSTPE